MELDWTWTWITLIGYEKYPTLYEQHCNFGFANTTDNLTLKN